MCMVGRQQKPCYCQNTTTQWDMAQPARLQIRFIARNDAILTQKCITEIVNTLIVDRYNK